MRSAVAWEQYAYAREQLQLRIADKIRRQMSSLVGVSSGPLSRGPFQVGSMDSADLLLVAADGKKLPAHECILRARAPGFYQRHVEATVSAMGPKQEGKLREVSVGGSRPTRKAFRWPSGTSTRPDSSSSSIPSTRKRKLPSFPRMGWRTDVSFIFYLDDTVILVVCEHCRKPTKRVRLKLPILFGETSPSAYATFRGAWVTGGASVAKSLGSPPYRNMFRLAVSTVEPFLQYGRIDGTGFCGGRGR